MGPTDEELRQLRAGLEEKISGRTCVVVGVGNELRGDDGAGVAVARQLAGKVPWTVIDAQTAPESFLMEIVHHRPQTVVVVDALDFGREPGAIDLIEAGAVCGQGPSTHGPAPVAFFEALNMMHPCRCVVLGIQPKGANLGASLSEPVRRAVELLVEAFGQLARLPRSGKFSP